MENITSESEKWNFAFYELPTQIFTAEVIKETQEELTQKMAAYNINFLVNLCSTKELNYSRLFLSMLEGVF